jgi:acetylglutamate synthase
MNKWARVDVRHVETMECRITFPRLTRRSRRYPIVRLWAFNRSLSRAETSRVRPSADRNKIFYRGRRALCVNHFTLGLKNDGLI